MHKISILKRLSSFFYKMKLENLYDAGTFIPLEKDILVYKIVENVNDEECSCTLLIPKGNIIYFSGRTGRTPRALVISITNLKNHKHEEIAQSARCIPCDPIIYEVNHYIVPSNGFSNLHTQYTSGIHFVFYKKFLKFM